MRGKLAMRKKVMKRYIALLRFTEQGAGAINDSPKRAEAFRKAAEKAGVRVEAQYWAVGRYDGIVILSGSDEAAVLGQLVKLSKTGNVRTQTLELLDGEQFAAIVKG
jgi:uncharacterized protein with GYD domain